ncbi:hypothetical protein HIR71_02775 [Cellulomonas fimi]|uniref:Uncharacterized protein n=1 Tax=Cellulomonas fimi TaxID=1708 RepID=A0A7Y0LXG7_CELFI|nr:hypothetical protein [Cellulomonas fimi]
MRPPGALAAVALLVIVQAAALVGLGIAWLVDLVRGAAELPAATVFLVVFALGVAAVLVGGIRSLWRGNRWARSPVITWQLLLAVMAIGWLGVEPSIWAALVLVSTVVVVIGLLLPSVVAHTVHGREREGGVS